MYGSGNINIESFEVFKYLKYTVNNMYFYFIFPQYFLRSLNKSNKYS